MFNSSHSVFIEWWYEDFKTIQADNQWLTLTVYVKVSADSGVHHVSGEDSYSCSFNTESHLLMMRVPIISTPSTWIMKHSL